MNRALLLAAELPRTPSDFGAILFVLIVLVVIDRTIGMKWAIILGLAAIALGFIVGGIQLAAGTAGSR